MKRFAWAAAAVITLLGLVGCDLFGTTSSGGGGDTNPSVWKIKGSHTGWTQEDTLTADPVTGLQTYEFTDLYATDYEFVLINPAGTEVKYSSDDNVTAGEPFTLGGSSNVSFTATQMTYTLTVNISDAAAPTATLTAGSEAAHAIDDAALLHFLKLKGNQFSNVNGSALAAWTEAEGTVDGSTESWDVVIDNKNGEFGFTVLEGFVAHVDIDASGLTSPSSTATDPVELLTSGGSGNVHLTDTTKDSSTYTITVTVDSTKTIGTGRYMISAELKTLGTEDWAFEPWDAVYIAGGSSEFGSWTAGSFAAATLEDGVATYTFDATATAEEFKIVPVNSWSGDVGFSGIDASESSVTLSSSSGNIGFTATIGHSYTITVDFTTTSYTESGVPTVRVTDNDAVL